MGEGSQTSEPTGRDSSVTPHELWVKANGDAALYLSLMMKHGLIVSRKDNPPPDHLFDGKTPACFCSICGGTWRAPWHLRAAINEMQKVTSE